MNDRDRFAAAALTGLMTHSPPDQRYSDESLPRLYSMVSSAAYKIADAMLRERKKWPEASNGDAQNAHKAYVDLPTGDPNVVNRVPVTFENHDAAPEARIDDRECAAHVATAGTQEPFAWYGSAARTDGGSVVCLCMTDEEFGQEIYAPDTCEPRKVIPLYRHPQPPLTDAERKFLRTLHDAYQETANQTGSVNAAAQADSRKNAATLRGLLERLGGEL